MLTAAAGAGGLVFRHERARQPTRLVGADSSTLRGLSAPASDAPSWKPQTPEEIAAEVAGALVAWRQAIVARNADAVQSLDRVFVASPDLYGAALAISAKSEADERVRAFSTRVLGKLKNPALAELFETLLSDKSPFVRQNAAWALGELAGQQEGRGPARRAVRELRKARAGDPAPDVRTAAKTALAKLE